MRPPFDQDVPKHIPTLAGTVAYLYGANAHGISWPAATNRGDPSVPLSVQEYTAYMILGPHTFMAIAQLGEAEAKRWLV